MEKKITKILDEERRRKFFNVLYMNNFNVNRKDNIQPTTYEIYTSTLVRRERHYVPCAYLTGNTLELTNLNIEEFKDWGTHKTLLDLFKKI